MKKDIVQFVIALFTLAIGGALEELLPKGMDVGWPVLLSAAIWFASRRTPLHAMLFAVAAGAAEDALCALPFVLSVSFFTLTVGLLRGFKLPVYCGVPAFFFFQIWLWIWLGHALSGNVFSRLLAAVPVGAVTLAATGGILWWIDRKAAVHEK